MQIRRYPNRYLDEKICEEFQNSLDPDKIQRLWRCFRETGNSIEGRIVRSNFKKVFMKYGDKNEQFLENLFDRFKLYKAIETKGDKEEVDLQDLVIALAILARIPYEKKLKFIFTLTDVDQDGCLSIEEIHKMIVRIQRNFCKQNSFANVQSASLLYEIAMKKAQRTYRQIMQLLKANNNEIRPDSNGLITCDEYLQALKKSEQLYQNEKFLPASMPLSQIMRNIPSEPSLEITEDSKKDFMDFRKQIYNILKNGPPQNNVYRYPCKVQIVKMVNGQQKVVDTLPVVDGPPDKKANQNKNEVQKEKVMTKKAQHHQDERRDYAEQKSQEQTLEVYKNKVKKMRQTKLDPRLNIRFDPLIRR